MTDLLDYLAASVARDAALDQVNANAAPWPILFLAALRRLPPGTTGTAEWFRFTLTEGGLAKPHHHNAWGGMIATAVRLGVLEPTGTWAAMGGPKSHARKTPVYRRMS